MVMVALTKPPSAFPAQRAAVHEGDAFTGFCEVTVIDRFSKRMVGRKTLTTSDQPPEARDRKGNWYGSQPTIEEIAQFVMSLPAAD